MGAGVFCVSVVASMVWGMEANPPESSAESPARSKRGLAVAALIVGVGAFLFGWVPAFGAVVAAVGVVLGIVALRTGQSKPMAWTGIGLSAVAAVTSLVVLGVAVSNMDMTPEPVADEAAVVETTPPVETVETPEPVETTEVPEPEPTTEPPAETTTAPEQPASSVAAEVEAAVLANLAADSFMDACLNGGISWACAVTEVRDMNVHGDIEVHVQESLTKDEAEHIVRAFINFSCAQVPDLDWVAVVDLSGGVRAQDRASNIPICGR